MQYWGTSEFSVSAGQDLGSCPKTQLIPSGNDPGISGSIYLRVHLFLPSGMQIHKLLPFPLTVPNTVWANLTDIVNGQKEKHI